MAEEHYYGGQAVLEGVMMRGREHWAIAVRKPDGELHLEAHDIDSVAKRYRILRKPGFRGVIALGQALAIGVKALTVSANQSAAEEEKLTPRQMALSMTFALLMFVGLFFVLPAYLSSFARARVESNFVVNIGEGVFRLMLFLGYLALIGRMREIRRVFQYHGAEHKTIAAFEHGEPLEPENVDRYSTLHVRCGTNFLLIVMIIAILVYSVYRPPTLGWLIASRVIGIPLIAGVSFEMLRLGARHSKSRVMRALMAPGLWLQKITTKPPSDDQIEVAIAAFREVRRQEDEAKAPAPAESPIPPPAEDR
ncbi:MAG TPA: DUF1385 domain-containing protein [Actinomycetota bacterium]|nr:DUF1385 domain-containing protein [Actinomycetota bacterium]